MSWASLRRWGRHVDVQLAATLMVLAAPVLGAVLFLSLAYAAHEMLEERYESLVAAGNVAEGAMAQSAGSLETLDRLFFDLLEHEEIAARVITDDRVVAARGPETWFTHTARDGRAFWEAVRAAPTDVLILRRQVGGTRIEMAASLRDFTKERGELMTGLWASLLVGLAGSAIFAIVATRRALRPLHDATRALQSLHAHRLAIRLPTRGTGDVVDQHADALNRALDRIEDGFGRTRAFSANVAHELRTPIHRLLNQSGAHLLTHPERDDATEVLLDVQKTGEEMEAIVEGLLLLAQADEGRLHLKLEDLCLEELLANLDELYRPACEQQQVALEVDSAPAQLHVDATLLMRALCNLIDNALAHTPPGGRIRVEAELEPESVTIHVHDTGKGVPEEHLERIFDRFHRVAPARSRRGAGLGLPVSRAIVRAMGGDLAAVPCDAARTCFHLHLPRHPD